jgi:hypothetical protein
MIEMAINASVLLLESEQSNAEYLWGNKTHTFIS